ncbi:hypothetical protein [Chryseobacterium wangxinyae]|uniref:hypothetical protein n=1 Tax=Chryseobacterium sp. CY353 TaxID=2997334 RepID=UPI002271B674|nr:hypothetical protein [Chryseobacterium sp. CY353]MCY0967602.1 hypothetical protein [Chryseobacterium sp. CY353]
MRNYIIYFLTSLFLLFVVESKLNVKTLYNDFSTHISHNYPDKTDHSAHAPQKISVQQISDGSTNFSFDVAEDDFQLSDTQQTVLAFVCVFALIYSFGLLFKKRYKPSVADVIRHARSVKTFILIRSIRI